MEILFTLLLVSIVFLALYGFISFVDDLIGKEDDSPDKLTAPVLRQYTLEFAGHPVFVVEAYNSFVEDGLLWFVGEDDNDIATFPLDGFISSRAEPIL